MGGRVVIKTSCSSREERELGRREIERGSGSCMGCASLSRVENLYSTPETDITDVRGKEVGVGRGVWRGGRFLLRRARPESRAPGPR